MTIIEHFNWYLDEKPEKPKEPEAPPPDPAVAPIVANKETIIEINTNNKSLGVYVVGGKMYSQAPMVSKRYTFLYTIDVNANVLFYCRTVLSLFIFTKMVVRMWINDFNPTIKSLKLKAKKSQPTCPSLI